MFRDTIRGLDKVFETEALPGTVMVVMGQPGTVKSGFTYQMVSNYLKERDEYGMLITLEESEKSYKRNIHSMGGEVLPNFSIVDYSEIRTQFKDKEEKTDFLEMIEDVIRFFHESKGEKFTVLVFDSLGALFTLTRGTDLRPRLFHFFKYLRDLNIMAFLIKEASANSEESSVSDEAYLSDGVIFLGMERDMEGHITRYIQIKKMRATKHSMEKHGLEISENGIIVLRPLFTQ